MTLVHPVFDLNRLVFRITDPMKTLYIRSDKELIPNNNYYISVNIGGEPLSFTNKFKKVVVDGVELYELDLFAKKLTLQMQLCIYSYNNGLSVFGWEYSPIDEKVVTATIEQLTDIYYEKGDSLNGNDFTIENEKGDKFISNHLEQVIVYHDSGLTHKIRHDRRPLDPRVTGGHRVYGEDMDNVLRYVSFMQGLAYENELKKILPY